jgi:hypothetical protein
MTYGNYKIFEFIVRLIIMAIIIGILLLPLYFLTDKIVQSGIGRMFTNVVIPIFIGSIIIFGGIYDYIIEKIFQKR